MQKASPSPVTRKLMDLQNMGVPALQAKFQELYGYPTTLSKVVTLRKRLAFRIQELYYGGFTYKEEAELDKIADSDNLAMLRRDAEGDVPLMPSTRLTRNWKGKLYEATVTDDGRFEYDGVIYRSLSGIATKITGSHWNGKLFFGVK